MYGAAKTSTGSHELGRPHADYVQPGLCNQSPAMLDPTGFNREALIAAGCGCSVPVLAALKLPECPVWILIMRWS